MQRQNEGCAVQAEKSAGMKSLLMLNCFKLKLFVKKAQRGQLDYELALRDQTMVGELHKIPRYQKKRFPGSKTRIQRSATAFIHLHLPVRPKC